MPSRALAIFFAGILTVALASRAEAAQPRHVTLDLISENGTIAPDGSVTLGIVQHIRPGWHTYWINPGDSGQPMNLSWTMPAGVTQGETLWPVPKILRTGPLVNYGYEDRATILQEFKVSAALAGRPVTIGLHVETLVCAEICVPEYDDLTVALNSGSPSDPGAIRAARAALPKAGARDSAFSFRRDGADMVLSGDFGGDAKALRAAKPEILPYAWGYIDNAAGTRISETPQGAVELGKAHGDGTPPKGPMKALVLFADSARPPMLIEAVPSPIASPSPVVTSGQGAHAGSPKTGRTGYLAALGLALLGGLVLNLMPCVFPVLSMKALSVVRMSEKSAKQARAYGIAYTAGILCCFCVIGLMLIALKASGEQIGWGFQLQNPMVVLVLSWLLFAVGLNFSGLFEISGSFTNLGGRLAGREGVRGSFFTGLLAGIVATPCTAPFMGAAIGYAILQPPVVAMSIFLALGFGLALPFLAICFVPGLRAIFPKPGPWMQTFREALAFPIYASAAWLVWVYGRQAGVDGVMVALSGMIAFAFLFWLLGRLPRHKAIRSVALLLGVAAMLALAIGASQRDPVATSGDEPGPRPASANGEAIDEQPYSPQRLAALLAGDAPVFVNMTADWCITCKVNEKAVLGTSAARALFAKAGVHMLTGDWTNQDAGITAYLARFERNGVPIYVVYAARRADGTRPEPAVLPQILTMKILRTALNSTAEPRR